MKMLCVSVLMSLALGAFPQVPESVCARLTAVQVLTAQETRDDALLALAQNLLTQALAGLRGPRPDGSYLYARLSEEESIAVPKTVDVENSPQTFTVSGVIWFGFRLRCPDNKNLFWGNAPAMVKKATLISGGTSKILLENRKLGRGEEFTQKFGAVLPEVRLEIVFEKIPGGDRDPQLEFTGLAAGLKDDPGNPNAELVVEVRALREEGFNGFRFPDHLEKALGYCRKGIKRDLEYILYLLNGTERERDEGVQRLRDLIRAM